MIQRDLSKMAAVWISRWWCNWHVIIMTSSYPAYLKQYIFCRVSLGKDPSQEVHLNMSWFQTSPKRPFQSLKNFEDVSTVTVLLFIYNIPRLTIGMLWLVKNIEKCVLLFFASLPLVNIFVRDGKKNIFVEEICDRVSTKQQKVLKTRHAGF